MATIQDEIRARIDTFTSELTVLVRQAALEAVRGALEGGALAEVQRPAATPAPAPRARARAAKAAPRRRATVATPAPATPAAAPAPRAKQRAKGKKRPAAEIQRAVDKLYEHIKANPGQAMEQISKAIGIPTRELSVPASKLLRADKIVATGEKNATRYSAK
jgi:hypothetical protein